MHSFTCILFWVYCVYLSFGHGFDKHYIDISVLIDIIVRNGCFKFF